MGSPLVMFLKMLGYGAASPDYELAGEITELQPTLLLAYALITAADPLASVPRPWYSCSPAPITSADVY
jgi:hypothetical protein